MTKLGVKKKETYDYGVRLAINPNHMIAISFDRARMERLASEWNARNTGNVYEVVMRRRVLMITDWYVDPLDTLT